MRSFRPALALCTAMVAAALAASPASGEDSAPPLRQASKHFQRGVALYGEADYRAALVEFRRAYALAPNAAVLYNVGETQYQLQDYAGALTSFEHFLAEAGPGDPHRAEVEQNLDVLRARVGHVNVVTIPPGADIAVDDQPMGKTPIERPLLVGIGHRKIVASMPGRPPTTRYIDVAADDNVSVTVALGDAPEPAPAAPVRAEPPARPLDAPAPAQGGSTLRVLGWTATGALAAGALTFGVLAVSESSALKSARSSFPASSETLNRDASLTNTYAMIADALAASAIVVGGITLASSLLSSSDGPRRGSASTPRVVLGPATVRLDLTF